MFILYLSYDTYSRVMNGGIVMESASRIFVLLSVFGVCLYSVSSLRLEQLFRKNSVVQIQLFYILIAMSLAYFVSQYLFLLKW